MAGVDLLTVRDLGGWGAKGGLAMVERYAHVAAGPSGRRWKRWPEGGDWHGRALSRVAPKVGPGWRTRVG